MNSWINWYEMPYTRDNEKLNDYVEKMLKRASWKLFENQKNIVHMAYETDNGIPKMREGAIDYIYTVVRNEFDWLVDYMVNRILVAYLKGNIEPSDEVKKWFEEDLFEKDADQFWKEIDDYIWDDYVRMLGEEKLTKLWEKWGKAPRKEN